MIFPGEMVKVEFTARRKKDSGRLFFPGPTNEISLPGEVALRLVGAAS